MRSESGQAIAAVLVLLVMLLIIVPSLVSTVIQDGRGTMRAKHGSTAYFLAEAGIDRGIWKLQDDPGFFQQLASSTIAGYRFDTAYADVPSSGAPAGFYTILLSSYSRYGAPVSLTQRVITASGRDLNRQETATIELIIQTPGVTQAPLMAQTVALTGNGAVHWGPILSLSSMSFSGAAINRWPRKYARASISAGPNNTDTNPAAPNYDVDSPSPHSEFWSFNEPPGVPDPPSVDIAYYKTLAQCSTCAVAAGFPGGGVYYPGNVILNNEKDTVKTVRYGEGTMKFTGCVATMGVTVAMGNLNYAGGPCNVGQVPAGRYPQTVQIPSPAWMDYRKIDTSAAGEYPGDLGGPGSSGLSPTYVFGAASNGSAQTTQTMTHFGFVYAATTWVGGAGTVIVGAVEAPNDPGSGSGGVKVYYQDNLDIQGGNGGGQYQRSSWDRKPGYWPAGL
jgi:hypothetical protein